MTARGRKRRQVRKLDADGNVIAVFPSIEDAAEEAGKSRSSVLNAILKSIPLVSFRYEYLMPEDSGRPDKQMEKLERDEDFPKILATAKMLKEKHLRRMDDAK